ncbi:MAG: hypothetical protein U1E65_17680 [Myxococcota bacterium]
MIDPIDALKSSARVLHGRIQAGDAAALARVRRAEPELEATAVLRRHCLAALAQELGFRGWSHVVAVLAGEAEDVGTLLYPAGGAAYWNIWSASYEEARTIHAESGGYLLAYKNQYFIADRHFVENLGLDPEDEDFQRIGFDWARPKDLPARTRLYARLITRSLKPAA